MGYYIIYGPSEMYKENPVFLNDAENVSFGSMHMLGWAVAVGWVIYSCHYGMGGICYTILLFLRPGSLILQTRRNFVHIGGGLVIKLRNLFKSVSHYGWEATKILNGCLGYSKALFYVNLLWKNNVVSIVFLSYSHQDSSSVILATEAIPRDWSLESVFKVVVFRQIFLVYILHNSSSMAIYGFPKKYYWLFSRFPLKSRRSFICGKAKKVWV